MLSRTKLDKLPEHERNKWRLLQSQIQIIKEIGLSVTRHHPNEWNEFMIVALGVEPS